MQMAPLPGEQRPGPANAMAIEGRAVFGLTITTLVGAAMGGARRRVPLEQPIGEPERILDAPVSRLAQTKPRQIEILHAKKCRRSDTFAVPIAKIDSAAKAAFTCRRCKPHVIAVDATIRRERSVFDVGPVFDALVPIIGKG